MSKYNSKIMNMIYQLMADENISQDDKEDILCIIADECEELISELNSQEID